MAEILFLAACLSGQPFTAKLRCASVGSKHLHAKKGSLSTIVFTQIVVLLHDARGLKKFFKPSFDSVCVMQYIVRILACLVGVKAVFCICTQGTGVWGTVGQFAVGINAIHSKTQLESSHAPDHNFYSKMHYSYQLVFSESSSVFVSFAILFYGRPFTQDTFF